MRRVERRVVCFHAPGFPHEAESPAILSPNLRLLEIKLHF
jgi:hypothetical protein